jgi:hypothetical protein
MYRHYEQFNAGKVEPEQLRALYQECNFMAYLSPHEALGCQWERL